MPNKSDVTPLVIVGSGVAGLGAAIHAARSRIKTVVVRGDDPGGLLTKTTFVENWPGAKPTLGRDLIANLAEQAEELGGSLLSFVDDAVEAIDFSQWPYTVRLTDGQTIKTMSLIIATGATPKLLEVPGEKEYWGRGVTTCAICDAPFYKGKEVVIVGGGDSAVEEALQLLQYARKVTILVRKDLMRAGASSQERMRSIPAIQVRYNVGIERIEGDENHVTGLQLKNLKDNTVEHMPIDGVFLAIGHSPNSQLVSPAVEVDDKGYIVLEGRTQATSVPGVFAAGEVDDSRYRQADVEVAEGKKAAMDAIAFLHDSGFSDEVAQGTEPSALRAKGQFAEVDSLASVKKLVKDAQITALYFIDETVAGTMERASEVLSLVQQVDPAILGAKVVVSRAPELATVYHVDENKVPCLILVSENAKPVGRFSGPMTELGILSFVKELVKGN